MLFTVKAPNNRAVAGKAKQLFRACQCNSTWAGVLTNSASAAGVKCIRLKLPPKKQCCSCFFAVPATGSLSPYLSFGEVVARLRSRCGTLHCLCRTAGNHLRKSQTNETPSKSHLRHFTCTYMTYMSAEQWEWSGVVRRELECGIALKRPLLHLWYLSIDH